ncbi:MAG: DivIVA domain-containing protein [Gemmatimonadota bacterium]|jgi:cell division initiation protein
MIDLTPLEVRQKKGDFRRAFRGYDGELVNDFLDLVADRMEELVKANMAFRDQVGELEEELAEFREKERMLVDALMAAERLRDEMREAAEKEAQLMMREAELNAETHRTQAAQALVKEEALIRTVQARRVQVVREFRSFLEREMAELAVAEERLTNQEAQRHAGGAAPDVPEDAEKGAEESEADAADEEAASASGEADADAEAPEAKAEGKGSGSRRSRQTDQPSSLVEK